MDAELAQLAEQPPCKRQVVGSSPTLGSIFIIRIAVWRFLFVFGFIML